MARASVPHHPEAASEAAPEMMPKLQKLKMQLRGVDILLAEAQLARTIHRVLTPLHWCGSSQRERPPHRPAPPLGSAAVRRRERAPGRTRWELLSRRRQQTRGTGNTYCDPSKIRHTSHPAKSHTYHAAGSRARLLTEMGSETPFLSPGDDAGGSGTGSGDAAPRNPAR